MSAMDPEMAANPQPTYKDLRDSMPVMDLGEMVVLTRRVEIDEALRNPDVFSSNADAVDLQNHRPLIPLQIDPPEHKKYRKLLDPIFAPQKMALLDESITQLVNDLIDRFIDKGEVDFAAEFSVPFPSQVFLTLLGLPLDELPTFLKMKDGIIRPEQVVGTEFGSEDAVAYQKEIADSIYEYFDERARPARGRPQGRHPLAASSTPRSTAPSSTRHDILDICFLFLIAGLDTVTATLDCMFGYLTQHPEQQQQLVEDPSLIGHAIEELLRWETPVIGVARVATADTEIGGCPVKEGTMVMALLGSGNTDEADLDDAHVVRFDREVNRHLAFGGGVHRCLGSHLARTELRIAMREWHRRIESYQVVDGHTLVYTPAIRSIDHFPMTFTAREG